MVVGGLLTVCSMETAVQVAGGKSGEGGVLRAKEVIPEEGEGNTVKSFWEDNDG